MCWATIKTAWWLSGTLRRFAITAGTTAGENGFTYGLLYEREQQGAEDARRRVRELVG